MKSFIFSAKNCSDPYPKELNNMDSVKNGHVLFFFLIFTWMKKTKQNKTRSSKQKLKKKIKHGHFQPNPYYLILQVYRIRICTIFSTKNKVFFLTDMYIVETSKQ
eukprot:TRINITY_DN10496_c0_g1_i1.p7 TRINITY_DN10496_c0_g1~~TRINITY_DN10496_c0_g1_i1.p7  ORF type:complete len:105 (-),score=3.96 TRINITY_DN10496_c0_g1_i1:371-685(-)